MKRGKKPTSKMEKNDVNLNEERPLVGQGPLLGRDAKSTSDDDDPQAARRPMKGDGETKYESANPIWGFGDTENDNLHKGEWRDEEWNIYKYSHAPSPINWRINLWLFAIILPVFIHTIIFAWEAPNTPSFFLRFVYFIFALNLTLIIRLFFKWVNEDSISGMVAQRHTKIAYFALLAILSLSCFTSGLFSVFAIRSYTVEGDNHWKVLSYVMGFLSPLLAACILIAPLPLYKTAWGLGLRVIGKRTCILPKTNQQGAEVPVDDDQGNPLQFYSLRLWEEYDICGKKGFYSLKCQKALHYIFVLSGVGLGWGTTVIQLIFKKDDREYHFGFCCWYLIVSVIGLILFLTQGDDKGRRDELREARLASAADKKLYRTPAYLHQISLLKEFIGLFYYLSALITVLVMNRNLVQA